jgi:uncharacterized damage-inducible protein DinB
MNSRTLLVAAVALAGLSSVASAQGAVADTRALWADAIHNVVESAKEMPEAKYGYRPIAGVRTFGELIGHVAGTQDMLCAAALGQKPPAEDAVEKTAKIKAALVAALEKSNKSCEAAYAQSDAAAAAKVDVFGAQHSRLYALILNAMHDDEHYGNLVTYLRMNGMVPPSSKPAK